MASIPREIQKKHNKLLVDLCDYIHIEDRWYTNFITFLRNADLPPGQLSHVENEPAKLFQLMEQKGKLKVGDYGVLEEAFENSGNEEALSLVRRLGCEITKQIKEQGPTTSSVAEKTAQKNDKSPNKRKRTAAQETILERDNSPNKQRKIEQPMTKRVLVEVAPSNQSGRSTEPRDDKDIPREDYYDRENKRGYLLILNFTKDREGTELDVSNLKKFFEKTLNFDVDDPREDRQSDFSLSELNKVLEQARNLLNFRAKKLYCFFCAILSHGDEKGILCDDGMYMTVDEIRTTFANDKMSNFVGKPRVFLIQACRGSTTQQGHDVADDWPTYIADVADKLSIPTDADVLNSYATTPGKHRGFLIQDCQSDAMCMNWPKAISDVTGKTTGPTEADVLIAYATTPGNKAWRCANSGSWFMHVTISVFETWHENEHVEEMFIRIKDEIAHDEKWKTETGERMMPCTWSTLTKKLII